MDLGPYATMVVVTLLAVAGHYLLPDRAKRIDRALARQQRARLQEARGVVRVTGRARRTTKLLQAPLSGRSCLAYEIVVFEKTRASEGGYWRRRVDVRKARPFVVADESGEALVDTTGPFFLSVVHDHTGATSWLAQHPGKHRALDLVLGTAGIVATNWLGRWRSFHYAEGVLEEGEVVSVGGASSREVDATGERPDSRSPPQRLVLRGTEAVPLLISDGRIES